MPVCKSALNKNDYAKGQIIIMFKVGTSKESIDQLIDPHNLTWSREPYQMSSENWIGTLKVPEGKEQVWIDILKQEDIVEAVQLNFILYPNDNDNSNNNECSQDSDCPQSDCPTESDCIGISNICLNGICIKSSLSKDKIEVIKIMPETASQKAIERLGELGFNITLKEVGQGNNTKAVYELTAEKEGKMLSLFKIKGKVSAEVDAETGEVIKIHKPWWAFLAKGI